MFLLDFSASCAVMTSLKCVWMHVRPWLEVPLPDPLAELQFDIICFLDWIAEATLHARSSAVSKFEWTESTWRNAYLAAIQGWVVFQRTLHENDSACLEQCLKTIVTRQFFIARMTSGNLLCHDPGDNCIVDIIVNKFCDDASICSAHYGTGPLLSLQFRIRRLDMFASLSRWVAEFTAYKTTSQNSSQRTESDFEREFRSSYVKGNNKPNRDYDCVDAAGYVLHSMGFYVAAHAADKIFLFIDQFLKSRAYDLAAELGSHVILPEMRVYHSRRIDLGMVKCAVEMDCGIEFLQVETMETLPLVLRDIGYPIPPVLCDVHHEDRDHFQFTYGYNTEPLQNGFTAAGLHYVHTPHCTLDVVFRVANDIPHHDAVKYFGTIHGDVLQRSPVFVRMSDELLWNIDMIWSSLSFMKLNTMAFLRFSKVSQTLIARFLGCTPIDVWQKVRFLMNVLTFLAQVDRMDNVFLLLPTCVTQSTLGCHLKSLCCW